MLTKIPDYIISDCGYPEWNSESQQLSLAKTSVRLWRNSTIWSSKSIKLAKMLPLRESLSDFYIGELSIQKEFIHKTQLYYKNNKQQAKKQLKELTNGIVNMRISQQHCPLDKRRSRTISADNEMDQF